MTKRLMKFAAGIVFFVILLGLSACETVQYYSQAVIGHTQIMTQQKPISLVIKDPVTKPELARRLTIIQKAHEFAITELKLPDNGSYQKYVDLKRPFVVWNVIATEAYSTRPIKHCFPVAGCVSYRGYFKKAEAEAFADQLKTKGFDTMISGASAYSTLGWFADPVVSSMLRRSDLDLAGLIFHELAHQLIYQAGDTAFNESFATSVELIGIAAIAQQQSADSEEMIKKYQLNRARRKAVIDLILKHRELLTRAYKRTDSTDKVALEKVKKESFEALRAEYQQLREQGGGSKGFDNWFAKPLNNASLVLFGDYHGWLSSFENLFERSGRDWSRFYDEVEALSKLSKEERTKQLKALSL